MFSHKFRYTLYIIGRMNRMIVPYRWLKPPLTSLLDSNNENRHRKNIYYSISTITTALWHINKQPQWIWTQILSTSTRIRAESRSMQNQTFMNDRAKLPLGGIFGCAGMVQRKNPVDQLEVPPINHLPYRTQRIRQKHFSKYYVEDTSWGQIMNYEDALCFVTGS